MIKRVLPSPQLIARRSLCRPRRARSVLRRSPKATTSLWKPRYTRCRSLPNSKHTSRDRLSRRAKRRATSSQVANARVCPHDELTRKLLGREEPTSLRRSRKAVRRGRHARQRRGSEARCALQPVRAVMSACSSPDRLSQWSGTVLAGDGDPWDPAMLSRSERIYKSLSTMSSCPTGLYRCRV